MLSILTAYKGIGEKHEDFKQRYIRLNYYNYL